MLEMINTSILSSSKRERFIYRLLIIWVLFGLFAIYKNIPLEELSMYFGAFAMYGATYIGAESYRESGKVDKKTKKEIADEE